MKYKIFLLEGRHSSVAVFDRSDKLTAYKRALKKADPEIELFDTHTWTETKPHVSNFNVPFNPIFKEDVYLKAKEKEAPKVKIKHKTKSKIEVTPQEAADETIEELKGIKVIKRAE